MEELPKTIIFSERKGKQFCLRFETLSLLEIFAGNKGRPNLLFFVCVQGRERMESLEDKNPWISKDFFEGKTLC